ALLAPVGGRPRASVVAAPRALHLDDLGAHVSEHLGTERPSDVLCQVGNDHAFERWPHGRKSIIGVIRALCRSFDRFRAALARIDLTPWRSMPTNSPNVLPREASGPLTSPSYSPRRPSRPSRAPLRQNR